MKNLFIFIFSIVSLGVYSQDIEQNWNFSSIKKTDGTALVKTDSTDVLILKDGNFNYSLKGKDNLKASGNYIHQNNLLIFNFKEPKDTVRYFNIVAFDKVNLVLSENDVTFRLSSNENAEIIVSEEKVEVVTETSNIIAPSQGFSMNTLWRGVLGMISLLIIAFLFSSNRKAIDWKTVGLGIIFQLLIAIGVLRVGFIQKAFEWIGGLFVSVLDYTRAGSMFLFDGLIADMDKFGFIFAFQVLPTIIFFSALTSLLFYLGLIQKLVKVLALLLTKVLKISGAESLSVAGNIFLGQTEAPLLIKAYLEKMNKSEMLLVMIGGMATVAGAVLAAYIGFLGGE